MTLEEQHDQEGIGVKDAGGFEKQERRPGLFSLRRFLPRSLFGRSLLILITPVVLIQVMTTAMFIDRHWSKVTGRLSHAVAGEIAVMASVLEKGVTIERWDNVISATDVYLNLDVKFIEGAVLTESAEQRPFALLENLFIRTLSSELEKRLRRPFLLQVDFEQKQVEVDVQLTNGVLRVSLPQKRLFSSSGYVFLLWVFGSSILLLVIAVLFMRNQVRPIHKLAVAARRFGKGRDVPSFKPEGAREVREAAKAFMEMHRRIKRQVSQRTAMLAGVSHDLRTPLTRIRLQLAMLGDGPDVQAIKEDLVQMEQMIDGYLDFVRGEGGEQTSMTDLDDVFARALKSLSHHSNISVHTNIRPNLNASLRPKAFERCLVNILQNAAQYGSEIWVEADITPERRLIVRVDDNGPGIPEAHFDDVFKPFYRFDSARSNSSGVGLGLPIAMDVVHGHGGKIWLEQSEHGGLRVNIRMPV